MVTDAVPYRGGNSGLANLLLQNQFVFSGFLSCFFTVSYTIHRTCHYRPTVIITVLIDTVLHTGSMARWKHVIGSGPYL